MTDLEAKLRDMADKGLLSHLSVYAQWGAHKSPTVFHASVITIHGQGHYESTDIVEAVLVAIEEAPKQARRHTPVVPNKDRPGRDVCTLSVPLAPAPVVSQPVKPVRQQNDRKTPRGQTDTPVPNLMELFK
jgi:hypothetical protein